MVYHTLSVQNIKAELGQQITADLHEAFAGPSAKVIINQSLISFLDTLFN